MKKILGKFYRVRYDGEGVYEALRKKVGWDWKNVKQDPDINWLPTPDCDYKDSYRSFFTTLGYNTFKAKTMKVISKYLDPSKIKVKEYEGLEGNLVYQDQYQVVVNNKQYFNESEVNDNLHMNKDHSNPIVFSENDIYLNWEKWITGESHVLIIDGLSGSGKSTLAKKIAKQEGVFLVSTDTMAFSMVGQKFIDRGHCNYEYVREKEPLLYKYLKVKNIPIDFMTHLKFDPVTFTHTPEDEEYKQQQVDKYIEWLCFEQHEKVVIEGGHAGVTLSRFPKKYQNTPIIFKGTSMFKSIFRRFFRALGKGNVYETLMLIFKVKAQYIEKMLPEVNTARKAMLTGREDDILYVDEGFIPIEAKKDKSSIHKKNKVDLRKIPTNIKDFKEFLQRIKTPEMVMLWFLKNKIKWTPHEGSNDHPFQWPDYLIKQKMGNCFDQSVFMHYFCKAKKLEHKMYLVTWLADNGSGTGHAVPLYKKNGYVYVFTYLRPGVGYIAGPFRDFNEAKGILDKFFLMYINRSLKSPTTPYSSFLSDDDINNFDKYYNDRSITQSDYIIEGLGKNMRSSHMFKLKAKGFTFPNPILPMYDIITFLYRSMALIYNHLIVDANTEIVEEESINEEAMDKYTRSYRDFDEFCKYIKTPQEVMDWYKINKIKWNKPTPTGEFYKKPITWPDDMVKEKEGDCFDHAIFMHYFCERNNIENEIVRFVRYRALRVTDKWFFFHHFVTVLKLDIGWVAFEYNSMPHNKPWGYDERNVMKSSLIGPFKTKELAAKFFSDFYDYLFEQDKKNHHIDWNFREKLKCKTIFLNDKVLRLIDKLYNDRTFTQEEFYNLAKSEMGDTEYEGNSYQNGGFFSDALNTIIVGVNKVRSFREESINESKYYWTFDDLYNISHKKKFDKIKNFDQFCREIESPEEALSYLILEKVQWNDDDNAGMNRVFHWPDDVIRDKIGVCMDQTILINYFLRYKQIEYRYLFMSWNGEDNSYHGSHVMPAFKRDGRYFSVVYLPNYIGWIHGPFDSWDECAHETGHALESLLGSAKKRIYALTEYAPKEFHDEIDKIYGKKVKFHQWIMADGCRVIRWSKMLMIQKGRFAFWNPVVTLWDITRFLRNTFAWDLPYYGLPKIDRSDYIERSEIS